MAAGNEQRFAQQLKKACWKCWFCAFWQSVPAMGMS